MNARRFDYPERVTEAQKKRFKRRTLVKNPDVLYFDTMKNDARCNLIFFTEFADDWKAVILEAFPGTNTVQPIDKVKLELPNRGGHVCIYPSGIFVIQGTDSDLDMFEERFSKLKEDMEMRRLTRNTNNLNIEEFDPEIEEQLSSDGRSDGSNIPPHEQNAIKAEMPGKDRH